MFPQVIETIVTAGTGTVAIGTVAIGTVGTAIAVTATAVTASGIEIGATATAEIGAESATVGTATGIGVTGGAMRARTRDRRRCAGHAHLRMAFPGVSLFIVDDVGQEK